jgi:hypothetical protein
MQVKVTCVNKAAAKLLMAAGTIKITTPHCVVEVAFTNKPPLSKEQLQSTGVAVLVSSGIVRTSYSAGHNKVMGFGAKWRMGSMAHAYRKARTVVTIYRSVVQNSCHNLQQLTELLLLYYQLYQAGGAGP